MRTENVAYFTTEALAIVTPAQIKEIEGLAEGYIRVEVYTDTLSLPSGYLAVVCVRSDGTYLVGGIDEHGQLST